MNYIILGSARGLGSYIVKTLRQDNCVVFGLDINPSITTDYIVNFENFESLLKILNDIFINNNGPFCCVYSAIPSIRLRGDEKLIDYIQTSNYFLTLQFNSLLAIASSMQENLSLNQQTNDSFYHNHIISIGSVLSNRISFAESPIYGASKAASHELIKYLSHKLINDRIICNTISPSLMARNNEVESKLNYYLSKLNNSYGITTYQDILNTIKFLSINGPNSINGQNIILDNSLNNLDSMHIIQQISDAC